MCELDADGPMKAATVEASLAETRTRAPPMPLMPVSCADAVAESWPVAVTLTDPALTTEPSPIEAWTVPPTDEVTVIPARLTVLPPSIVRLGSAMWVE